MKRAEGFVSGGGAGEEAPPDLCELELLPAPGRERLRVLGPFYRSSSSLQVGLANPFGEGSQEELALGSRHGLHHGAQPPYAHAHAGG